MSHAPLLPPTPSPATKRPRNPSKKSETYTAATTAAATTAAATTLKRPRKPSKKSDPEAESRAISLTFPYYRKENNDDRVDTARDWENAFVPCFGDDDSERNRLAKEQFRASVDGKTLIFFAGGHSQLKNSGVSGDPDFPVIKPVVSTIFFSQLGEVAISSVSKHTSFQIFARNVKKIVDAKPGTPATKILLPGEILRILETEDIPQNDGCPLVLNETSDDIENLFTYWAGTVQPGDIGNLRDGTIVMRNPCCLYVLDTVTGKHIDLAPMYSLFKNNIGAKYVPLERPKKGKPGVNEYYTSVNPYTFIKDGTERPVELSDIYDAIRTYITGHKIAPEKCSLLFLGCRARSCGIGRVLSSGKTVAASIGGKTKKRRRRNRTRSRQMRRHARTKRK